MTNKFKQRENYPTLVIHSTDNSFGFGYRKNNNHELDEFFIKKFCDSLATPITTPKIVQNIIPKKETKSVFSKATT